MSAISIWALVMVLVASPAYASSQVGDYSGLPPDLAAAATAYDLAQFKSDRSELVRLPADDYVLIDATGKRENKAEDIADAVSPQRKTTSVDLTDQVRRVWANGAVLGGVVNAKGFDQGKAFVMKARFVDVWAKRHGHWQVVFTQINDLR